ncbi:Transmembrane protein 53 [Metarhizium anisopliae]|nr:Transmembrane protein 53 [Metarhizium anisopliae]
MTYKTPVFSGFTLLSDQVFTRPGEAIESDEQKKRSDVNPTIVLLYGWGDGTPKHVAKYADGFRELFPHATQIVILSPIYRAMFSDLQTRSEHMVPVLKALSEKSATLENERILVHAMSNTGGINYAATLNSYQEVFGKPLPHRLLSLDSTPGNTYWSWSNVSRWSRAMTLGTAAWFPWPFAMTQSIWAAFLSVSSLYKWMIGQENPGTWSVRALSNEKYEVAGASRLYLYSKEDDLIGWEDIESNVAEARALGRKADTEMFDGSGHVEHMRKFPKQYWAAIQRAWQKTM